MTEDSHHVAHRRGGHGAVSAARRVERTPRLPSIRYGIKPVTAVTEAQLDRIHTASMRILQEIGIAFRDEMALRHWREAGADVHGNRVQLGEAQVMGLIALAPSRYDLCGRAGQRVEIGPDTMTFGTIQGAPNVRDLDGVRRS